MSQVFSKRSASLAIILTATLHAQTPPSTQPADKPLTAKDLIDIEKLKPLLPATLGDFEQSGTSGTFNFANMGQSVAHADYKAGEDEPGRGSVDITDYAGQPAMVGNLPIMMGVGNNSDDGDHSTKTIDIQGHQAIESFGKTSRQGEIKVIVGKRFLVDVSAEPMDEPKLKAAADAFDYKSLEALGK